MHVPKHGEVDAVFVENVFKGCLAGDAGADFVADGVPWSVARDDDPGGDCAVNGGEVCFEELDLLIGGAERGRR